MLHIGADPLFTIVRIGAGTSSRKAAIGILELGRGDGNLGVGNRCVTLGCLVGFGRRAGLRYDRTSTGGVDIRTAIGGIDIALGKIGNAIHADQCILAAAATTSATRCVDDRLILGSIIIYIRSPVFLIVDKDRVARTQCTGRTLSDVHLHARLQRHILVQRNIARMNIKCNIAIDG